jgi:hypothetical protein
MGEIIFLSFLGSIGVVLYILTYSFEINLLDKSGGAAMFPRIVIIFLLVFIIIRIISLIIAQKRTPFVFKELFQGKKLLFVTSLAAYVILMKPLGYIICSILFLLFIVNNFFVSVHSGWGTPKQIAVRNILSILFVIGMKLFFSNVLKVFLPVGIFGI